MQQVEAGRLQAEKVPALHVQESGVELHEKAGELLPVYYLSG